MIVVDVTRCTGCGACVEVCPTGALYLVDGKAAVDDALCRGCETCLAACPCDAISLATHRVPAPEPARVPALRREPEILRVRTSTAPLTLRSRMLPILGAALAWTGRELVPRLADIFIERLDRPASPAARQSTNVAPRSGPCGQQAMRGSRRRRRQRGGGRRT